MARKQEKRPDTVACGNPNCTRSNLDLRSYSSRSPSDDVEQERVHWRAYPALSGHTIMCTCGHYTVFYNPAERTPPAHQ